MNHTLFKYLEKIASGASLNDQSLNEVIVMYYEGINYTEATNVINAIKNEYELNNKFKYELCN